MTKITEAGLDYLRNINTRAGPNAGKSIDPTKPGPDADRIAELARLLYPFLVEGGDYSEVPLDEAFRRPRYQHLRERAERAAAEFTRLRNEQPKEGDAPGHSDLMVSPETIEAFMEANPLPAPLPEPQDVREALGRDWISEAATRITNRLAHEGWIACESYVRDDVHGVCQEEIAALAQSNAQPIERARYHLQAADHALHDIEGDPFGDHAHTLVHEAAFFITDEPELQAMRKLPAQSDAQPVGWRYRFNKLREWNFTAEEPNLGSIAHHYVAEPLYTAPHSPDASVLIEALEQALDCICGETPEDMSHEDFVYCILAGFRAIAESWINAST